MSRILNPDITLLRPQSDDPFIKTQEDMYLIRLGHFRALVDYMQATPFAVVADQVTITGNGTVASPLVGLVGGITTITATTPTTLTGYLKGNGTVVSAQAIPIPASDGGTGNTSYTIGDILYASGATVLSKLAGVATGNALISGGVGIAPSWSKIDLTTHISGILPPSNGGTGTSTVFTQGSVIFAGPAGVYAQDNPNFFYDDANNALRLGGATYQGGALNILNPSGTQGLVIYGYAGVGGNSGIFITHANTSTAYVNASTGYTSLFLSNTNTTVNSNSMIRYRNGTQDSAVVGTLYIDNVTADYVIAVARGAGDITNSTLYIKGSTGAVAIGNNFKTPTALLHLAAGTTTFAPFKLNTGTALTTPEDGAIEYHTSHLYFTIGSTRYQLDQQATGAVTTMGVIGAAPNANGASISGVTLTLQPASASFGGVVTTLNQTFSGIKTFDGINVIPIVTDGIFIDAGAGLKGINITGVGTGITANVETVAGTFTQSGILAASNTNIGFGVYRSYTLGAFDATGNVFEINDSTASTGNLLSIIKQTATKVVVKSTGNLLVGYSALAAAELFGVQKNQNTATAMGLSNTTSGTAATAIFGITNSATFAAGLYMQSISAGYTTSGIFAADTAVVHSDKAAGLNLGTSTATQFSFWTNNIERARFLSSGEFGVGITPSGNGLLQVKASLSTTIAKVGGVIFDFFTDTSVGGAEADIYTTTLTANILGINGDKIIAVYGGNFVTGGTEATQLKVYFAGTAIWDSTGLAPSTGTTSWRVSVEIIRVSSTVIRYTVSLNTTGASGYVYAISGELIGLTLSGTNILKITGTSSGVGSGAGDIIGKMGFGQWKSAA